MHPRALAALGRDLVTNDVVALIELVKNSYDAMATTVHVRFRSGEDGIEAIDVVDDGHGMDRSTIENVWCVVATPFRHERPLAEVGGRSRTVTGDKGLGRLSAARLGRGLEMVTRSAKSDLLRIRLDWEDLSKADKIMDSRFVMEVLASDPLREIEEHGTRITISGLNSTWDRSQIDEVRESLARLVSPFSTHEDFRIRLTSPDEAGGPAEVEVEAPDFFASPKYSIRGRVDGSGVVLGEYQYDPIVDEVEGRRKGIRFDWSQVMERLPTSERVELSSEAPDCGPFSFEIRAWDLASDDTLEIQQRFDISKSSIRAAIREHKGISVYRDDILVLPKSEEARDWLGLDLRRVSRVGLRLSTSQIVGYVQITKERNPRIVDTSDRERLTSNPSVTAFQEILRTIVATLEGERQEDRRRPTDEEKIVDLFEDLTADELLADMVALVDDEAPIADALPVIQEYAQKLDDVKTALQTRFTYYSRLATVGTIAQMLIHEIRNRTTAIDWALQKAADLKAEEGSQELVRAIEIARSAVHALERLADRFAPLASRSYRRGKRSAAVKESLERMVDLLAGEIKKRKADVSLPSTPDVTVAMDPGELDAVLLNLTANALYWLGRTDEERRIRFQFRKTHRGKRVTISLDDSGPGVREEETERIFWPGVTNKPGGIGMGLTVASELVAEYGGRMALVRPGRLGGATFQFDVPLKEG